MPASAELLTIEPPASLRGARLLLVENNPLSREVVRDLLVDAGVDVTIADNGRDALAALARARFDGVLMDVQMPVMDGYEATRAIRAYAPWRDLPVIALTSSSSAADRERSLAAGMNDHLTKPIEVALMFDTLARWIGQSRRLAGGGRLIRIERRARPRGAGAPDPLGHLPGIDARAGRAAMLGNEVLYRRLLWMFTLQQRDFETRLRAALGAGDLATAARWAHDLGALAASLGMRALNPRCKAVESACGRGASAAEIETVLAPLLAELGALTRILARLEPLLTAA